MARLIGKSDGFTIVEVAVTLVVIGIFMAVILSMQAQVSQISVMNAQHNKASLLAYNNMRRYANDSTPSWFKCTRRRRILGMKLRELLVVSMGCLGWSVNKYMHQRHTDVRMEQLAWGCRLKWSLL